MVKNIAFIDGQNLIKSLPWNIDYKRFKIYLKDKYKIDEVYYFLGFVDGQNKLYENLQKAGFILIFNSKGENLKSNKKGNIDVNLVFEAMKRYAEGGFDKFLLVSGDGDFFNMVDFFIEKDKFIKILFPNRKNYSSLYNSIGNKYFSFINGLKDRLQYKKKSG
ncbi:NYN domain-containing protein [Candidatus Gracilibacteria bacterium]|nr:NYN domain-containing protein [Candidatus Gracilibacteria bacterium]